MTGCQVCASDNVASHGWRIDGYSTTVEKCLSCGATDRAETFVSVPITGGECPNCKGSNLRLHSIGSHESTFCADCHNNWNRNPFLTVTTVQISGLVIRNASSPDRGGNSFLLEGVSDLSIGRIHHSARRETDADPS